MKHEIDTKAEGYTAGGNPVCTCGAVISPGGLVPHLQDRLELLEEETALLRRHSTAQAKSAALMPGIVYVSEEQMDAIKFVGMIVCEKCGNKWCPRAGNNLYKCTGSNKPGQIGELE